MIVSGAAGVSALGLVLRRRFQLARLAAALAVAAIVAGWALAQQPQLLPGLTVDQAAAPHDTLIALIIAVAGGGIVVIPSLTVLLRLSVAGRLGDYRFVVFEQPGRSRREAERDRREQHGHADRVRPPSRCSRPRGPP